jgi:hypothetical protein
MAESVTCFVVVAESVLESRLLGDLTACGARGWTMTPARGQGPRGRRVGDVEGGNIRVEALVSTDVAARIWAVLEEQYFAHYAVTAWTVPVTVARGARYA